MSFLHLAMELKKMLSVSVSGNAVMEEHTVTCCGRKIETVVTSDSDVICAWILLVMRTYNLEKRKAPVVGLAIKWRPDSDNPVVTLCIGFDCLIIQTLHTALPQKLFSFLADPRHIFIGFGVKEDAKKLRKEYNMVVECVVDLRDLEAPVLKKLVSRVLWIEFDMEKRWRVTLNYEKLSTEQVRNTSSDAFVSYEVGSILPADTRCSIPVLQGREQECPTLQQIIQRQTEQLFAIFKRETIYGTTSRRNSEGQLPNIYKRN